MGALATGGCAAMPAAYELPPAAIRDSQIATPPPTTMATIVATMTIPHPTTGGDVSASGPLLRTRALDALEKASGWDAGAPTVRGDKRSDLNRVDMRPPCALGARFGGDAKQEAAE